MFPLHRSLCSLSLAWLVIATSTSMGAETWPQAQFDGRRSGNVPERTIAAPLGLVGAVPLTDAIFTSPVVADGRVYVVDGSGVAMCIDAATLKVLWKFESQGGAGNCNNISSPALVKGRLHFGTMAGSYYVLNAADGKPVKEINCGEPIFSSPAVSGDRAYFATLGAVVYAVDADGNVQWTWDFVKDEMKFPGDRWSGEAWQKHKNGRVTWRDHFCCSRDIGIHGKTVVIPAGGRTIFLEDAGSKPELKAIAQIPNQNGSEFAAAFGQSIGEQGEVFVQWHRRDNVGRVEVFRLKDGKVEADYVRGTSTAINLPGHLSFSSVAVRGTDVYRTKPEQGLAFSKHAVGPEKSQVLGGYPSIAPPVLLKDAAVYGALDGSLQVVPLSGERKPWSFKTAFGKVISAPVAVCDGRVYFGCEDGYLYVLGPGGKAALPDKELGLEKIRTPLTGPLADPKYDWYTNYGDLGCTNSTSQNVTPPFKIAWMRRYEGTVKHIPVCGGGRMYVHTAEGIVIALEQTTGRLLWRRYFPNTYLSFTSPIYHQGKLLVPQAGLKESRVRCFEAASGKLLWEAPFTGSPSWSRQGAPIVQDGLVFYGSGSGQYTAQGTETAFIFSGKPKPDPNNAEIMSWIYTHDNPFYPKDNKPYLWAWDLNTGKEVWKKDFSEHGTGGNDCGLCWMDGKLYYSTFFGYSESLRKRRGLPPGPNGITAALDPKTGKQLWLTTKHYVTAGCALTGRDGRLYLGGWNKPNEGTNNRYVWCLDAKDGSLVWQSDPVGSAVNVVTVGDKFIFSQAARADGNVFDKATGKIVSRFNANYNCTRFTLAGTVLMGTNMDMIDLADNNKIIATGPAIDSRECLGAIVSNGKILCISQASGMLVSQVFGAEAKGFKAPWERK